jgi:prepilin peptidase CpaA
MFPLLFLFLTIVLIIAAVSDLRVQRIPNWLTFSTMIVAVAYHTGMKGLGGLLFSLGGISVGIAFLIIPYLMGGMGAGDAKLMGSVGALLGPKGALIAFLSTAIVGGIYALVILTFHGYLKEIAKRYGAILKTFILTKEIIYIAPAKSKKKPRLCYGVAIALGTLISVAFSINI